LSFVLADPCLLLAGAVQEAAKVHREV
jgi:hypothetical protein